MKLDRKLSPSCGWVWLRAHLVTGVAGTCGGVCICAFLHSLFLLAAVFCLHLAFLIDKIMRNQRQNYYAQIVL